jgi:TRAP-type C4-dicarboxylate transport system substrate-binding protein
LQVLLSETALESAVYERQLFEHRSAGALDEVKKNGMTVLELTDREKWVEASRSAWDEFAKSTPGAGELIDVIKKTM